MVLGFELVVLSALNLLGVPYHISVNVYMFV